MEGPKDTPTDNPSGITERFEIEKVLSAGKSTLTYKALDTVLNEEVTVKTMAPDMVKSENLQLFHNDLRQVSKVEHDSIAKILDYGQTRSGKPYVVLEYLDGICLKDRIKESTSTSIPIPLSKAISLMRHLCDAVNLAHEAGVVHQDLKPSNIFLLLMEDDIEIPVIVDFGFGQLRKENERGIVQSTKGEFAGDPVYMSPEQIEGMKVDKFSDYYSLGCLFFELLTGKPPYQGNSFEETFAMQLNEPIPDLVQVIPKETVQIRIEEIVTSLLEKEKSNRHLSLIEISETLRQIEDSEFKPKKIVKETVKKKTSFNILSFLTSTVLASVLLIGITTYLSHNHSQKQQNLDKPVSDAAYQSGALIDPYLDDREEKHLKIRFLNISDQDIEKIKELRNLETLQIGGDKVTKAGLQNLMELENLTSVKVFNPKLVSPDDFNELNEKAQKPLFSSITQ